MIIDDEVALKEWLVATLEPLYVQTVFFFSLRKSLRLFDIDVMQNPLPLPDMYWHWLRKTNHSINYVKIVLIDWMFFSIEVGEMRSTCSDGGIDLQL